MKKLAYGAVGNFLLISKMGAYPLKNQKCPLFLAFCALFAVFLVSRHHILLQAISQPK